MSSLLENAVIREHVPSEAEQIVSKILESVKGSPEQAHAVGASLIAAGNLALEVGALLQEYAERDAAEALSRYDYQD